MSARHILTIIPLLFFLKVGSAEAQTQEFDLDNIQYDQIHVTSSAGRRYSLGSANQLRKAFGAGKVIQAEDEVLGGVAFEHKYEGLEVYFNGRNFEGITIKSPKYSVLLNGKSYRVGESIKKLAVNFPKSLADTKLRPWDYRRIFIGIMHKKISVDAFVIFSYDTKGTICEIWIGNNNS